jgi:hypothetical protein
MITHNLTLTDVESSNVAAFGWVKEALVVAFKSGAIYRYDVDFSVYEDMAAAPSLGKFVNAVLRPLPCAQLQLFEVQLARMETYADVLVWAADDEDAEVQAWDVSIVNRAAWKISEGNWIDLDEVSVMEVRDVAA